MKSTVFAAAVAAGLAAQPGPATAWYHWDHQPGPTASGLALGFDPAMQTQWWSLTSMGSRVCVEQAPSPWGYYIRVYTPGGPPGSLEIGVLGGAIVVRSSELTVPNGPFPNHQIAWAVQWLVLPADANLSGMRMYRDLAGVEIFVPRFY